MKLKLVVPHLETNLQRAEVSRWHVDAGSECDFGQPLCDLSVSERIRLRPTRRADALVRLARGGKYAVEERETERGRFVVTYRVLASERARITELRAARGDTVEEGTLLAMAETDVPDEEERTEATTPLMRAVAVVAPESDVV